MLDHIPLKLDELHVWWQQGARSAAENLAVDEALLDEVEQRPILRFYQWSHRHGVPWTLGYFQRWTELPFVTDSNHYTPGRLDIARRWTGGGLVCHQGDLPYTLTVPADHWLAKISAVDCYRWIHERLAAAIREATGIAATAQPVAVGTGPASPSRACFAEPVHWDVVIANTADDGASGAGKKIAGAAQRRSRGRLLHQGSVILATETCDENIRPAEHDWQQSFAKLLCDSPAEDWSPSAQLIEHTNGLARDRYMTKTWTERF